MAVIIRLAELADVPAITEIYNEAIVSSPATFDLDPKTVADRTEWFMSHDPRHPVWVAEVEGKVVGWASLTLWSNRAAYDDTAETSFYVDASHQGRGIGRQLLATMIEAGERLRYHTLVGRMTESSRESIHLHEQAGFVAAGTLKEVGRKFDRFWDVIMMQKMLR